MSPRRAELAGGSQWVLPSPRRLGRNHVSLTTLNNAMKGVVGLPDNATIHDLRRTIRTGLSELGVSSDVAELCLNHRPTGIQAVYDRSERLEQRAKALQRWADYVDSIVGSGSSVIPFTRGNAS